jgi:hypothetical protein
MIRFLSRPAMACLLAGALVVEAHAQQSPPAAGSAPTASQSASYTESHLAAARELATITGITQLFDRMLPQFGAQIRQVAVTRPELTKDLDQVLESLNSELEQQKVQVTAATARVYASRFSEAELKEIVAFFKTPIGQKYTRLTPFILDDVSLETQRWAEQVSEYVMTRVRAEMGKRGHQM